MRASDRSLLIAILLMSASCARAGIPSPSNSTCPPHIAIVARNVAAADTTLGAFDVTARHLSNTPWNEGPIWLDVRECPDCRIDSFTPAGATSAAICPYDSPGYTGDVTGHVRFSVVGSSTGRAGTPGPSLVWVLAEGVLLAKVPVAIYDLDGNGGLGAGDLSLWLTDFGTGQYIGRDDYDGDAVLGTNDLSLWLTAFGTGRSSLSAGALCP